MFYRQCEENGWLTTKDWEHFLVVMRRLFRHLGFPLKDYSRSIERLSRFYEFNLKRLADKQEQLKESLKGELAMVSHGHSKVMNHLQSFF